MRDDEAAGIWRGLQVEVGSGGAEACAEPLMVARAGEVFSMPDRCQRFFPSRQQAERSRKHG
jgi:hypothetical protein